MMESFSYTFIQTVYFRRSVLIAFANLQKATISLVVSVCLSVRIEQLGYH
jgi:hypothetical protein